MWRDILRPPSNVKLQTFHGIYTTAPAMQELFGIIRRAARTHHTVTITGESGTGKELVARALPAVENEPCCFPVLGRRLYTGQVLTEVDRDVWLANGPSVSFLGVPYPTRMTVVRLRDGTLWACSPIQLDDRLRIAITALGLVRHLVSPNKLHHLFLGDWARAWPDAKLYASPGLARRRRDLSFDAELGDQPDPAWAADVDQVIFHGSFAMEEVVFFHRASRTAIVTDLVQRFDPASLHGWRRVVMTLDGLVGPNGSTPREWRLSFWNRVAARRAKRKVIDWNARRVIIAHGEWVRDDGGTVLERALAWLG